MLAGVFTDMERLAECWKARAKDRRAVTPADAAADALGFCAAELTAAVKALRDATERLTVPQYASLHAASPAAVRRWLRNGELAGEQDVHGDWRIAREARRKLPPRVRNRRRGIRNEIARDAAHRASTARGELSDSDD